jgi:hypothetical protein
VPYTVVHDAKELDAWELVSMELDTDPDATGFDIGLEVLCYNLLIWALLS